MEKKISFSEILKKYVGPGQDMPQASTFIAFIEGMTEEAIV